MDIGIWIYQNFELLLGIEYDCQADSFDEFWRDLLEIAN
jgi:hypothetical protein